MMVLRVGLLLMFFASPRALAVTRYVDGNLTAECTAGNYSITNRDCTGADGDAYITIADGLTNTASADTLAIRAGTYDEGIGRQKMAKGGGSFATATIIKAHNSEAVIIQPSVGANCGLANNRVVWFSNEYVIMDGITIDANDVCDFAIIFDTDQNEAPATVAHHNRFTNGALNNAKLVGALFRFESTATSAHHNEVLNSLVDDNGSSGFDHGFYIQTDNNIISGNTITNNFDQGIQVFTSQGVDPADDNTIMNNFIHSNGGWCIILGSGDNNLAYNNVCYDNGATESNGGILIKFGGDNNRAFNNTIVDNTTDCVWIEDTMTNTIVQNNICWTNGRNSINDDGISSTIDTNLFSDPLFVDHFGNDFRITNKSPARNAGVVIDSVSDDFSGTLRPQELQYDIGALEYSDGEPPAPTNLRIVQN